MTARRFGLAVALLLAAIVAAIGVAVTSLRGIAEAPAVEIAVPESVLVLEGGLLRGRVRDGLPAYALHWDGQPPSAVLVDRTRGSVLAASAFSDDTFARNRNAVRFTDGEARIVLDPARWTPGRGPLVLSVEAVPSRWRYHVAAVMAIALALALLGLIATRRLALAPPHERPAVLRRLAMSALFLLIAAGVFAAVYPGAPVRVAEVTDEANINSFAAALDHPERFVRDKALSDRAHYEWYTPVYIGIIRASHRLGFHYETANAFLGLVIAGLLLFGLQRLFATITRNELFGLAAALALGLMLDQDLPPPGEIWSIVSVLPRMLFTAFLPWVLLVALRVAPFSRRWWIACAAAGLLAHLYPLSAPVLIGAMLVAFVVASDEPYRARLTGGLLATGAAIVTMAPYIVTYSVRYAHTVDVDPAVAARALAIVKTEYGHLRPAQVLRDLVEHRVETGRILLDIFALIMLVGHGLDRAMRFYLGLVAGFLIVAVGLPMVDLVIAEQLGRRPYQIEMIRAVRFFDLFVIGACAVGARNWRGSAARRRAMLIAGIACVILAFGPGWYRTARIIAGRARLDWRIVHGRPDVPSGAAQEAIRAVRALRAPDERVMGPIGLRQYDVPVSWVPKDIALLSYSQARGLLEAVDTISRARPLLAQPITRESAAEIAGIYDATLLLVRRNQLDESLATSDQLLFENSVYAIVRSEASRPCTVFTLVIEERLRRSAAVRRPESLSVAAAERPPVTRGAAILRSTAAMCA